MPFEQSKGAAQAPEHAQAQNIDLHEAQIFDIGLFPFDYAAVDHRGGLDRDQRIEPVARQHEAAGMLRQMPRRAEQLLRELQRQREARFARIEVERLDMFVGHAVVRPAPHLAGKRGGHVLGQAEHLADFADAAARAEAADDGGERGVVVAVRLIDPLDHVLAPFMFEIDVDVGRFGAVFGQEAFEQQLVDDGVDRSNAEHEANHRIRRRSAPLAQDFLAARKLHD